MRLIESGSASSKQLLVMPKEQLTNWEWLPGEHLNGLKCSKAWFPTYEASDLFVVQLFCGVSIVQIMV